MLARWRLKWVFVIGLVFIVLRFLFSAFDTRAGLLFGVSLHGASFVPVYITAQIYVDQRMDPAWRGRAQSLLTLMFSGVGNLLGYLGNGWWFAACTHGGETRWPIFWGGLTLVAALILAYFLIAYRGNSADNRSTRAGE
jgi:MFS family permease